MKNNTLYSSLTTQSQKTLGGLSSSSDDQDMTVLYCRLSQDDKNRGDSDSIVNQKKILLDFAKSNKLENPTFFIDDGISGTTFDRDGFQQAVALVKDGRVKNFVVKDLSRFGRDYLQVGIYTEVFFPEKDVRFIAINDNVDSNKGQDDFSPLRNLFNEWYARDTSKKITSVKRAKGLAGEKLSSFAPYGYKKDPNDRNNWLVDDEAAEVVRKIFRYCKSSLGPSQIARKLKEEQVSTPAEYYAKQGQNRPQKPSLIPNQWDPSSVVGILERTEYLGHTVNFKTYTKSYKTGKSVENKPEDYAIFKDTHEPIIDQETFDLVQKIRSKRRRNTKSGRQGLFSGIAHCPDCGSRHYFCTAKSVSLSQERYVCSGFQSKFVDCDNAHYIRETPLAKIVLADINKKLDFVKSCEAEFIRTMTDKGVEEHAKDTKLQQKKLSEANKRFDELDSIIKRLYEDNVAGKLTDERFVKLSKDYEIEQKTLTNFINETETTLSEDSNKRMNVSNFISIASKYTSLSELTPIIVNELIDRIEIHKPDKSTGKRIQKIDIYYSFIGNLDTVEIKK